MLAAALAMGLGLDPALGQERDLDRYLAPYPVLFLSGLEASAKVGRGNSFLTRRR